MLTLLTFPSKALAWLQEVIVMHQNFKFANTVGDQMWGSYTFFIVTAATMADLGLSEWKNYNVDFTPSTKNHVLALSEMAEIYTLLGNTAMALSCRWRADVNYVSMPPEHRVPTIRRPENQHKMTELMKLHHPDPKQTPKLELQGTNFQ